MIEHCVLHRGMHPRELSTPDAGRNVTLFRPLAVLDACTRHTASRLRAAC